MVVNRSDVSLVANFKNTFVFVSFKQQSLLSLLDTPKDLMAESTELFFLFNYVIFFINADINSVNYHHQVNKKFMKWNIPDSD